ncbi:MAG: hypothetical protein M1828_001879 [Chrysothrix sp. TS-e1954]|nr:MAG: hypothetical protein M1828_001879 [Chrysothrix sp. TS-e1954]
MLLIFAAITLLVFFLLLIKGPAVHTLLGHAKFCYNCFLKPHDGDHTGQQQDALESFYKAQAAVYDSTRMRLLQGREDLLGLMAAHLKHRTATGAITTKPIWIDIGGGTGYNIEQMQQFLDVPATFEAIFLVDLSPSLCKVAEDRFRRLGWKNVNVICDDARSVDLDKYMRGISSDMEKRNFQGASRKADLITMSYSLSMIPEFYPVIDALTTLLSAQGVIGVVDFYVQSEIEYQSRTYIGGQVDRHCTWISRVFWRTWFEADRVSLEAARRDYLEYRFGTILSHSTRCRLAFLRIPYYIWIGCSKEVNASPARLAEVNAAATESPFIAALDLQSKALATETEQFAVDVRSKEYDSAVVNLAASLPLPASWYQAHHWRLYYNEQLQRHRQFGSEYMYAFTWEDVSIDARVLKIREDDVVLAITSAGDNILAYALEGPKRIHAVDMNPNQNHLLELKLAAFTVLGYSDVFKLFGEGKHAGFRKLLLTRLSPHLSSLALQYWFLHGEKAFVRKGLYNTGGSRHALRLVRWLSRLLGLSQDVARICTAQTLNEQREIWNRGIRRVLLSRLLSWTVISKKGWLWHALGVPHAQRQMIEHDYNLQEADLPLKPPGFYTSSQLSGPERQTMDSVLQRSVTLAATPLINASEGSEQSITQYGTGRAIYSYAVNTLDPVVNNTLLSHSNHYYLVTLLGHYTQRCHPDYLTPKAHARLSRPPTGASKPSDTFSNVRIHTDEVVEVISRMTPDSLTIAVLMDSLDWYDAVADRGKVRRQINLLHGALKTNGRVLLRSAGVRPWWIAVFEQEGFRAKRVNGQHVCIDMAMHEAQRPNVNDPNVQPRDESEDESEATEPGTCAAQSWEADAGVSLGTKCVYSNV